MITALSKWGNSLALRIPQTMLAAAGLKNESKVDISCKDNMILIKAVDEPTCLADLFKDYNGAYSPSEIDFGKPIGKEVW